MLKAVVSRPSLWSYTRRAGEHCRIGERSRSSNGGNRTMRSLRSPIWPSPCQYPEAQELLKVHGGGALIAMTFVLTIGSKDGSYEVAMLVAT